MASSDPSTSSCDNLEEDLETRLQIHSLNEKVDEKRDLLVQSIGADLRTNILLEGSEVFKKVKRPQEAALDSNFLAKCSIIAKQAAQGLHTDVVKFNPIEFAEKFKSRLNNGEKLKKLSIEQWNHFGAAMAPLYSRSPPINFMLGTFERGPKEVKVRKRKSKVKDALEKATAPEQLKNMSTDEESSVENVERILSILKGFYHKYNEQPLCYFEFVVDPESFSRTIENMFHVSFLLRDGLARLSLDEEKLPVIEPIEIVQGNSASAGDNESKHLIISMTPDEWQEIVRVFKIKRPLIPVKK